jgi:hypothetical protein
VADIEESSLVNSTVKKRESDDCEVVRDPEEE